MAEAVCKSQKVVIAAETMVIPRSLSWAIQSVTVVPSSTEPCLYVFPVSKRTLSVVVVLPASMWAIIPMFLIFSNGTSRPLVTVMTIADFFLVTSAGISQLSHKKPLPLRKQPQHFNSQKGLYQCSTLNGKGVIQRLIFQLLLPELHLKIY